MLHDQDCERGGWLAILYGSGCKCAARAYKANPLPEPDWTPVWAVQKTPGQEGG